MYSVEQGDQFRALSGQTRTLRRILGFGIAVAVLAAAVGRGVERLQFGATDEEAYVRIERELHQRFDERAATLQTLTARMAALSGLVEAAPRDRAAAGRLFDALDAALDGPGGDAAVDAGITVYDANARPLAWSGRVSDVNRERIDGPAVQYVAPGAFGPFLVRVEPLLGTRAGPGRLGTIVAEQLLGDPREVAGTDSFLFAGSLVPVSLRTSLSPEAPAGGRSSCCAPQEADSSWKGA